MTRKLTAIVLKGINPEPWRVGEATTVRRGRKLGAMITPDPALTNYQEAVREELRTIGVPLLDPDYHLRFWWWRQIVSYEGPSGRMVTKRRVDQTNMQKALEDALQTCKASKTRDAFTGVITNDAQCISSGGFIVEQAKDVAPVTLIEIGSGFCYNAGDLLPWEGPTITELGFDVISYAERLNSSTWVSVDVP